MKRSVYSVVSKCLWTVLLFVCVFCGNRISSAQTLDFDNLETAIERVRAKYKLPALGAALVATEGVQHVGVSGTRKRGDKTIVTKDDLWSLASDGKAITATMIARLVEQGTMQWEQTLGDSFPSLASSMSSDMKSITLFQLLSHQSGLKANFETTKYVRRSDLKEARLDTIREAIKSGLQHPPGTKYLYSNWGYTIAGAMAESSSGKDFETLIREEIFAPLQMTSAGFGGTGTVGKIDQPWPHDAKGKAMPSNGPAMENVPTMSPAGTMHMNLEDWGKFVAEHLRGPNGSGQLLKQETFKKLHSPNRNDYGLGWISAKRGWAGGAAITHAGDNTMCRSLVWAAPVKGFAVIVVTNQSDAAAATDEIASELILAWEKRHK